MMDLPRASRLALLLLFLTPSLQPAFAQNIINSGTTLQINTDITGVLDGFLDLGGVTLNGGELLTNNLLDLPGGLPFSTGRILSINLTGGTLLAANGTIATYNGAIINGNGGTGLLTVGNGLNTGTIVLTAANSYTGGTLVNGATLRVSGLGTLGAATGALGLTAGGTLDLDGTTQTVGALTLGGGTLATSAGTAILNTAGVTVNGIGNTVNSGVTLVGNIAQGANSALAVNGTAGADSLGATASLGGTGTLGLITLSNHDTVTSSGTLHTGGITVNGTANILSGAETATAGVTVNGGGVITQTGMLTGALIDEGSAAINGTLSGNATVGLGGTLAGGGTITGTTGVTGGTINGTGLNLTGLATFNGTGNVLSGTETGSVALAAGASVTQSGALTGNVSLTNGAGTTLNGTGTVGTVTLNGGGDAVGSSGTLASAGLSVNGVGNTISTGTVVGNALLAGGATLADNGTLNGNITVGNGTLGGSGNITGTTGVTGGTVNGSGLDLANLATFNGTGNVLSGTETGNIALAAGAVVSQAGTLTGNVNLAGGANTALSGIGTVGTVTLNGGGDILGSSGTLVTAGVTVNGLNNIINGGTVGGAVNLATGAALTDNGTLTGALTVGNGTLTGTGSVTGMTGVTGGTINGTGLNLGGSATFNGAGNILSGTESGAVTLAAGASLNQSGTLTGNVNLNAGVTGLTGIGTVGTVTLNGGGNTLASIGTLTTGGIDVSGLGNTIASGTVSGNATLATGSSLAVNANLNGGVDVGSGTLTGTGTISGGVTVGSGGTITLQDGAIGTLTVGSLATGSAGAASTLSLDVGDGLGVNDKIQVNGALNLNNVGGTIISIGNATGVTSLVDGTYSLVVSTGLTGTLADVTLATTTLDGKVLSIDLLNNTIDLTIGDAVSTVGTSYTVVATADANRIMSGQSTGLTTTITNNGSGPADTLNYTGLGATAAGVSGATTSGGPLATNGGSASNTGQSFTSTTAGAHTLSAGVTSATNATLLTPAVGTTTGTTIDVLNNRTESATAVNLGRMLVNQTSAAQTTTISSVTGDDDGLTRITLGAGAQAATGVTNGTVTLGTGTAYQFGGANDATNSTTRTVTGSFSTSGIHSGMAVIIPTGEGLTGEAINPIDIGYTADAVAQRTIANGATTNLGTLHNGAVVNVASTSFTTSGLNATTTSVQVAAGSGTADGNGVTLNGAATTFDGSVLNQSGALTFGGDITGSGTVSGAFNLGVTTLENGGLGLAGETAYAPVAVAYTANVYSGVGVYVGGTGGSWGTIATHPNFSVSGGAPGLDPNFTTTDSATFGNSIGINNAVVTLDGDSPSLNAITFDNTLGGSYTLAQGTGGKFKLNAGAGGTAQIDNAAGNDTISAPVELDSNAAATVANGDTLILSGPISQAGGSYGLTLTGPGTTVLSGANSYNGGTTLVSGTLDVTGAGTLGGPASPVTIDSGLLDLGGTTQNVAAVNITGASTIQTGTLDGASFSDSAPAGTVTITAHLGGAGGFAKSGASTLLLNGANSFAGPATISGGTVVIGNLSALGSGDVSMSDGVLELGNGVHQINVGGNYTQSGGTLVLNLTGLTPGASPGYEFLHVAGTANLGGALIVNVAAPYVPVGGDTFTFVQAGTITGGFSSETTNLLSLSITPQGQGLIISQLPLANLPTVPYTPNEETIAQSIDNGYQNGNTSPAFVTLLSALNALTGVGSSPSALANAMSELSPEKFASFTSQTSFNQATFDTESLNRYLDSRRGRNGSFISNGTQIDTSGLTVSDPSMDPGLDVVHSQLIAWNPAPRDQRLLSDVDQGVLAGTDMKNSRKYAAPPDELENRIHLFVDGSVVLAQGFSQADLPHENSTTASIRIGGDYQVSNDFLIGTLFEYSRNNATLDDQGSKAEVDSYSPGIFASYAARGWYANALATYSRNDYTEDRDIDFLGTHAKGSPSGNQINGSLTGGYDFHSGNWVYGPTASVLYTHLEVDGFSETGSVGDLNVNRDQADSLRSLLGAHASYEILAHGVYFHPHISLSWQHEYLDQSRGIAATLDAVGGGSFNVQTEQPSRDSAVVDLGLNVDLNRTATIFADYMTQVGQADYFAQYLQAGLRIGF